MGMDLMLRPARHAAVITPSDSANLQLPALKGIYVGTAGTLKVVTSAGNTVTLTVIAGLLSLQVTKVFATGTTAANLVALY